MKELQKVINSQLRDAKRRVKSEKANFRARARRGPDSYETIEGFMGGLMKDMSSLAYAEGQLDQLENTERSLRFLKENK